MATYEGQTLLGHAVERQRGWEAIAADGQSLGLFRSRIAASRALSASNGELRRAA